MSIITIGIDLAKNIFAVHGVDQNGKAVLIKPRVSREVWHLFDGEFSVKRAEQKNDE